MSPATRERRAPLSRLRDYLLEVPDPAAGARASLRAEPAPGIEPASGAKNGSAPAAPSRPPSARARLLLVSAMPGCSGAPELAAAVGVAAARRGGAVLVADVCSGRSVPRPTLLSSWEARMVEEAIGGRAVSDRPLRGAAARGAICCAALAEEMPSAASLGALVAHPLLDLVVAHAAPDRWRKLCDGGGIDPDALILRAQLPADRAQAALVVGEMRRRGVATRIATRGLGPVARRRALAGLEPGGAVARRHERLLRGTRCLAAQDGQALPLVLGAIVTLLLATLVLVAFGSAVTAKGRMQRAADLAAVSAARSMRDDHRRLFTPARDSRGRPNPAHLPKGEYLERARDAALEIARANGAPARSIAVSFPDRDSIAPVRARVELRLRAGGARTRVDAEALAAPAPTAAPLTVARGGGYSGPLEHRQGKPMRPDVATAFDRMSSAALRAGVGLTISSAFRSDAEQARLFAANPDPRWVAPPGRSLHRCGTELDLGPPSAHGWLAANAPRFGFVKRYSWEPWHFGYERGPAPCSAAANRGSARSGGDGSSAGGGGLPSYVPGAYRAAISRAAARHGVAAGLLAAQLMAESNFNPFAVSRAGARGIAQFMPGTAAAYGLSDPFDAPAAIDAQARLMADLLARFGRTDLALAAYNAGPAAVEACGCTDPYAETAGYVARILGLLGGAAPGALEPPGLEVRLVD